jgi:hypothetical protein
VEEVDELVEDADARGECRDRLPVVGREPDLLGELALRGLQRTLALVVEDAGRDLEEVRVADGDPRLADEVEVLVVVDDGRRRAGVVDHFALDLLAVRVAEALEGELDDAALVDGLAPQGLETAVARGHRGMLAPRAPRRPPPGVRTRVLSTDRGSAGASASGAGAPRSAR